MKGKYIILESGEGAGKSTHAKLLVKFLNSLNFPAVYSREPGSTPEAEQIREVLKSKKNKLEALTELFLFEAARTEFFAKEVLKNRTKGITTVADRSGFSSEAYQGYAGGVDLDLIRKLNFRATAGIHPDLFFLIDIDARKGLSKEQNPDRFAAKGLGYHKKVNQGYREIAKRLG